MCVCLCARAVCVHKWVSVSVHRCMQSQINNCWNLVRLLCMIHWIWMIRGTSKSTTPVPQIQRFDSLEAGNRSPTGPPVMSLAAFASIIWMTQYYFHLKTGIHKSDYFSKIWIYASTNCQLLIFMCSVRDLDVFRLFAKMSIKSTLGVLLNWFHLLGTFHQVLPVICLYPPPRRCPPLSTAKTSPPSPVEPRM